MVDDLREGIHHFMTYIPSATPESKTPSQMSCVC